jgi:hypothetical protein
MHTFVPCPQFFCLIKHIAHVCTLKMAEDELSAYSASSQGMPELCNKPPFSAFTRPLSLAFRGSGQTWHMESQEFGPRVQNFDFTFTIEGKNPLSSLIPGLKARVHSVDPTSPLAVVSQGRPKW